MYNNRYTQAVDNIKAPKRAVDKMLETTRNYEKKEKVIFMKKWIKGAVAAAIAIAIIAGSGIGINMFGSKNENSFVITANAAEITENAFTPFSRLSDIGGEFNNNSSEAFVVNQEFDFNCFCQGNNIKLVKYTVENGTFDIDEKYVDENEYYVPVQEASSDSFVIDYTDISQQSDYKYNFGVRICTSLSEDDSALDDTTKQAMSDYKNHINYKLGDHVDSDYSDDNYDIKNCEETLYRAMLDKLKVKIDVTFEDGDKQSKTMIFSCDEVDNVGRATLSTKLES